MKDNYDLVIVGAGIVGAALAVAVAKACSAVLIGGVKFGITIALPICLAVMPTTELIALPCLK